ncbi:Fasciclin-like arabinogalactan family protein [Euphorbia peplus]|nr:Fasciclin-like arabinogalactan family protein [Euphorbia peplus]
MAAAILLLCISLLLLSTAVTTTSATVTASELDAALSALRSRGYTLFPNAIATSDISLLLLSLNSTFTLFSPPDLLVFSLDLSSTATDYVHYLLRHVSPHRLSMADLRRGDPYIDTLVSDNRLFIDTSVVARNHTVLVDGVRVLIPDIFLGDSIAVHGLEGILVSEFGSGGRVDGVVDSPVMSPVAWGPQGNSPMVEDAVSLVTEPRGKNIHHHNHHNHHHQNVNLDEEGVADGDYALFSHLFGG